jgi:hypothetical protein
MKADQHMTRESILPWAEIGRNRFLGRVFREEQTTKATSKDGWRHSADQFPMKRRGFGKAEPLTSPEAAFRHTASG